MPAALAVAVAAAALPVGADAHHRPGHTGGAPGAELTISAAPATTVFQRATVLSGTLKGADNAGKKVTLRADEFPFRSDVRNVATTTTDAKGNYTFTRHPGLNTGYQVAVGSTVSPTVVVKVRIRMTLAVSDRTPRVGQLVRFTGRACPAHDGLPVRIQRKTSKGAFRTVRRTTLRGAGTCSTFTRQFRIHRDGTYRVTSDDADHARGFSTTRFINTPR